MRIISVSQLIAELQALNLPAAQVNVSVRGTVQYGAQPAREAVLDGPVEYVEKVFLPEGPAVRIWSNNGAEVDE